MTDIGGQDRLLGIETERHYDGQQEKANPDNCIRPFAHDPGLRFIDSYDKIRQ